MTNDNLALWESVSTTDPANVKPVSLGARRFSAIDAYSQIRAATEAFGPVGSGWGWDASYRIQDGLVIAELTMWHGERAQHFTSVGCAKLASKHGPDDDSPKKALTDAITKGLSYLGFNADVFLGEFDGNKYTQPEKRPAPKQEQGGFDTSFTGSDIKPWPLGDPPSWLNKALRFGKFKGQTMGWLASGAPGGERHGWLKYMVEQGPNTDNPKFAESNQRQHEAFRECIAAIEARGGPEAPDDPERAGSPYGDVDDAPF